MKLYGFERLASKLDELGFPEIQSESGPEIIKGVNFEEAYKAGSISFENDGIYLEYEGKKYRGYMFIKEPWIEEYGSYPKFHLTNCQKIREFIATGRFKHRYDWSNSHVNDLIDKTTRKEYKDEILEYCSYCKKELFEEIEDTYDFHNTLTKSEMEADKIEVDIFGYVRGKEKISKDYRIRQEFECEVCSIRPKSIFHRKWWHTHHIDGDKTNNTSNNLQCLCVLCHANVNNRHRENFTKGAMAKQVEFFMNEYKDELNREGNPYL